MKAQLSLDVDWTQISLDVALERNDIVAIQNQKGPFEEPPDLNEQMHPKIKQEAT